MYGINVQRDFYDADQDLAFLSNFKIAHPKTCKNTTETHTVVNKKFILTSANSYNSFARAPPVAKRSDEPITASGDRPRFFNSKKTALK